MHRLYLILLLIVPVSLIAQEKVSIGGMTMEYSIANDIINISLEAPTKGWVGIGFNTEDNIVGSDLILLHVLDDGKVEFMDMFVKGAGDPKIDESLGGKSNVSIISSNETDRSTQISLQIPFNSQDQFDFNHSFSKDFYLILAYSVNDDFDHHSRMRKHIKMKWKR